MFNDRKAPSANEEDCSNCTQHIIDITNNGAAQDVHVGAHVWQDRTYGWYNPNCQDAMWGHTKHRLVDVKNDDTYSYTFDADTGAVWTDAMTFAAGETREFIVLLDWERANVAKDWSLTAWGTTGNVVVRNKNTSILSDHMP